MKHLPVIFITLSIILSVIACVLPNWATMSASSKATSLIPGFNIPANKLSKRLGLFTLCSTLNNKTECSNKNSTALSGILAVQIFSIASSIFLVIGAVLCSMNIKKEYVLMSLMSGIVFLLTTLIIFATSTLTAANKNCTDVKDTISTTNCYTVSTSWYLELGAVVLAIVGVVIKARSSRKK